MTIQHISLISYLLLFSYFALISSMRAVQCIALLVDPKLYNACAIMIIINKQHGKISSIFPETGG